MSYLFTCHCVCLRCVLLPFMQRLRFASYDVVMAYVVCMYDGLLLHLEYMMSCLFMLYDFYGLCRTHSALGHTLYVLWMSYVLRLMS